MDRLNVFHKASMLKTIIHARDICVNMRRVLITIWKANKNNTRTVLEGHHSWAGLYLHLNMVNLGTLAIDYH
jgi:hypothetical protein